MQNFVMLIEFLQVVMFGMWECGFGCIVNIILMLVKMLIEGFDLFSGVWVGLIVFFVGVVW